ncbi:MAG: small basic family protein [Syntrophothermus sp.]
MWLPVLGLVAGILIGLVSQFIVPLDYANYMAIATLAALDSVFGGVRSALEEKYDNTVFISGFFTNTLLAALLTYLGNRLGVDLMMGATVAFSIRIFMNLGIIRRHLIVKWQRRRPS